MTLRPLIPAILCAALAGGLAIAQATPSDQAALALALGEAQQAAQRARGFEQSAAQASSAAERARSRAEALVARIEASEAEISAAEARVRILDARLDEQEALLEERQEPVLRLAAALQTMSRRPPALALAQPGSLEDMARVRAVLGATLPVIRQRTAGLRGELAEAGRLRSEAARALEALAERRRQLGRQRVELAKLEESERQRSSALAQSALAQSERSVALTEEARDLSALAQTRAFQAEVAKELAALPPPLPRPGTAAPSARPPAPYRLPIKGKLVTGFGEISDAGIHARGTTLRPSADTVVVAPRPGSIAYAGRFRSYGEIVIVDHGGGWTTTVTNLAALRVAKGAAVKASDPLGRAAANAEVTVELRRNGRPQPIAAFLSPP